ncbi:MAG: hypothetical protein A2X94_04405 [Bdellovibrionales bacterium GWB1_55_8]|nr:MAG: hypothetical protein A2X94_04405 [Bdellovibrionales bacterium GWB1_55_8]
MKVLIALAFIAVPSLAFAKPADLKVYKEAFPDKAASASCKTCHTKGKELNDYGKKYLEAGKDAKKAGPAE